MNTKFFYLFIFLNCLLLFTCKNSNKEPSPNSTTSTEKEFNENQNSISDFYDTTLSTGYYVKYVLDKKKQVDIHWGNAENDFKLASRDYDNLKMQFVVEYSDFIGLKGACGSPCWFLKLLPKSPKDSMKIFDYPIAYDTKNNLLLWHKTYYGNEYRIQNIQNNKSIRIILDKFPLEAGIIECIDSVSFGIENLYIRWKTALDFSDNPPLKDSIFKLNFLITGQKINR
jgi:hypothetical protein